MRKLLLPLLVVLFTAFASFSQVSVTATAGTAGPTPYTTLNAAFTAINAGTHQGSIVIAISANTTEPGTPVPLLKSASPSSYTSILIKPAVGTTPIVTGTATANRGIIELAGADNVTIDGSNAIGGTSRDLTITHSTATTAGLACVRLSSNSTTGLDGADNVTVKNCVIKGSRSTATSTVINYGIEFSNGVTTSSSTTGAYSSINTLIENNAITRCNYGIHAIGSSATYPNTGLIIRKNVIGSATATDYVAAEGIAVSYTSATAGATSVIIEGNDLRTGQTAGDASYFAIGLGAVNAGATVRNNNVHDCLNPTTSVWGMAGVGITSATSNTGISIYNNFFRDINGYATSTLGSQYAGAGIIVLAAATGIKINHNTFLQSSASASASVTCINFTSSTAIAAEIQNNIFIVTNVNTNAHAIYTIATANISTALVNYNDYYVSNGKIGYYNAASSSTLAAWRTATSKDASSLNTNVTFASSTDLHIPAGASQLESGGTNTGITTDIDGETRPGPAGSTNGGGTMPDIGADEFDGIPVDLTAPAISYTALTNTANTANPTLTGFAIITDASNVNVGPGTAPRLYFKKSTDPNNASGWRYVEASNGTSPFDFTIDYGQIGGANPGDIIQYFVVAQDNNTTPNVGINSGVFNAAPTSVDLSPGTSFPITGTINSYFISTVLTGDIFVGSSQPITSLTNAGGLFDVLNNNIVGSDLTVHITSDLTTETGAIALNQSLEDGAGGYTITIRPDAPAIISGTSAAALIKLNGADRIVFDGSTGGTDKSLTISNTNVGTASGVIWVASASAANPSLNVTVKNCLINGNASTTTLVAVGTGGLTVGSVALANNNNFTVQNNTIIKAQYAIYTGGVSTSSLSTGLVISDNLLGTATTGEGFNIAGVKIAYQDGATISKNDVQNIKGTSGTNLEGITLVDTKNMTVSANKVHGMAYTGTSTTKVYGISTSTSTFSVVGNQSVNTFVNNMVYDLVSSGISSSWNTSGINNNGGYNDKYYFNSVYLTGSLSGASGTAGSACFSNGNGITTTNCPIIDIRNNIFYMKGTSVAAAPLYAHYTTLASYTGSTINNNDLLSAATAPATTQLGYFSSTNRTNLSAWQAATSQDGNSFSVDPQFTSATDLHINSGVSVTKLESTGAAVGFATDIDGQVRPGPAGSTNGGGSFPDMGADEFDGVPDIMNDIQATAFITPVNGGTVGSGVAFAPQASFTNNGTASQTSVTVRYRILNSINVEVYNQTTTIASINALATVTATFPSGTIPSAGTYTIIAKAELVGDQTTGNDQISGSITGAAPLSGTYFVGASQIAPNFTNLTNAVTALNSLGASSAVIFKLKGDYSSTGETLPITINVYPGASSTNTVTILPDAGVIAAVTGSSTSSIFKLNGADYVTIDGSNSGSTDKSLTITNSNTTAATAAIWVASLGTGAGATNNTFKNLNIATGSLTASTFGIAVSGATIGTSGADNDNITIQNNSITVASTGIYAIGTAAVSTGGIDNLVVTGNTISHNNGSSSTVYAIRAGGGLNGSIASNTIDMLTSASTAPVGISLETDFVSSTVSKNKINRVATTATGGYGGRGITVGTGTVSSAITISNNMITGINGSNYTGFTNSSSMGIMIGGVGNSTTLSTVTGGVNIYYNSINLYGSHSYSSATITADLYAGSGVTALDIRNNVFVNSLDNTTTVGSKNYGIYSATADNTVFATLNYNDFYLPSTTNSTGLVGFVSAADQATLSAWKTATGKEVNSTFSNPVFTSNTDLHINSGLSGTFLESGGTAIGGITTDIDGNTRPGPAGSVNGGGTAPDMGADEFDGVIIIPCSTPSAQPTALNLTPGTTSATGSFTAASPAADYYLVVRTTASSLAAQPLNATSYTIGANTYFGTGGYVESVGTSTTITSTGLTSGTAYYYWIFSYSNNCTGGPLYRTTTPLSGNVTTTAIFTSIASGNWDNGSTWNQSGAIPTSSNDVTIANGHNVTVSGTDAASTLTINTGGTLTATTNSLSVLGAGTVGISNSGTVLINGGTVTVGPAGGGNKSFTNNSGASLTVSTGILNVNGNFSNISGGLFTQSGGAINVDGNAGGISVNSVAASTAIVNFASATATDIVLSGGTFTIVDPHANSTLSLSLNVSSSVVAGIVASTAHTFRFGDGVSTDAGGNAEGFKYYAWASTGILKFGNLIVSGPTGTNRTFSAAGASDTYYNLVVRGDMTINNGGEYRNLGTATTAATYVGGNITVNTGGTFTTAGNVYFGDAVAATSTTLALSPVTTAQTVSGAGTFRNAATSPTAKFASVLVNNTNSTGVTFASAVSPVTLSGALTVTTGNVTLDALTLGGTSSQAVALTAAASIINVKDFTLNNTGGATLSGSGKLNVANTANLTAGALTTGGRMVLKSSASGTARIPAITGSITGLVTAETYIPGGRRAFRFLGHPFSTALDMSSLLDNIYVTGAGAGFDATTTNNPSAYWYNNTTNAWTAFTSSTDASWTQYRGARVLVRGDRTQSGTLTGSAIAPNAVTLDVTGTLNTGATNVSLPTAGNYHLVSNPYPAPTNIGTVIDAQSATIGTQYWVWDANASTKGAYVVRTVGSGAYNLAMGASFVAQPAASTTLAFTEANKTASATAGLFRTNPKGILELQLLYNDYPADNLFVKLNDKSEATMEGTDGIKLINTDMNFYTLSSNNEKLSLDARPLNKEDVIKLGLTTNLNSTYKIKVANYGLSNDATLFLKDKYINTLTPIDANTEYAFTVGNDAASQGENRFEIVMKQAPLLTVTTSFDVTITPNPVQDQMVISYSTPDKGQGTVRIFNAAGKAVSTTSLGTVNQMGRTTINIKNLAAGVYNVEMTIGKERVTKQIVKL